MPYRLTLACVAALMAIGSSVPAQVSFGTGAIPPRRALARVNLDMQWNGVVPLNGAEKLTELSIDHGILFGQTNLANFYAFDAETGRYLWTAHLGQVSSKAEPASVNSFGVYVTNSNQIFALDLATGRQMWAKRLPDISSSTTNANDDIVTVGLVGGKLMVFDAKTGEEKWNIQTNDRVSSRALVTNRLIVFGSEDNKLYVSRAESPKLIWRFASSGPIVAPLGSYGLRTILLPSLDKNLYAIDLFTGESHWVFASGAPISREPLVAGNDIYIVNDAGYLSEVDAPTGQSRWTISTLGGRLLSVSQDRVYLQTHDDDLFVVDRQSGKVIFDPTTTFQRSGINLRDYKLGPTNRLDDRLYFGTKTGLILCLREISQVTPRMIRNTQLKPFGYIPPEGFADPFAPHPTPAPTGGDAATAP